MEPFPYHVFVCDQKKPEGAPSCCARGSLKVLETLRAEVAAQGLGDQVQITTCGSLGLCERGPNMVVYPGGVWYSGVTPADVAEIVREHFGRGQVVRRLARQDAGEVRAEMEDNKRKRLAAMKAKDASGMLPDDLADRLRAFQESRVLLTAVELDLFTAVGDGATAAEVARQIGTDPRATGMLMNALVALEALERTDGGYKNTPVMARYFTAGSKDYARPATMHTVHLWKRWSTLTDAVRTGTAVSAERGEDWTEAFIAAMHRNASARAPQVVGAVGAASVRRMLDVGGGSGAYSIAFAKANPELHADILDLADVVPIAQRHIREAGVEGRVKTCVGDLRADNFGAGYDLVFISQICHMLGVEGNRELIRKAHGALAPGGRIVIQDFMSGRMAALFALNMLVGTKEGSTYSEDEYAGWLRQAGFRDIKPVRLPGGPSSLMIAQK
jgi:(2Fe-2S) ferredoxin/SAM-dependent methyltransferase/DNA-binding CsgD family transcriptional regulator